MGTYQRCAICGTSFDVTRISEHAKVCKYVSRSSEGSYGPLPCTWCGSTGHTSLHHLTTPPQGMSQSSVLEKLAQEALQQKQVAYQGDGAGDLQQISYPPHTPRQDPYPLSMTRQTIQSLFTQYSRKDPVKKPSPPQFVDLPIEEQVEPITAYKRADLRVEKNGIFLVGPIQGHEYELDSEYGCHGVDVHESEKEWLECSCGFYSRKTLQDVLDDHYEGNVILEVELSGLIQQGVRGYKSQHQRIMKVFLGERQCNGFVCSESAIGIGVEVHEIDNMDIESLCVNHYESYSPMRRATLAQVASALGTEVCFLPA